MKLSEEAIEAIEVLAPFNSVEQALIKEALTNSSIYEKANLISLKDFYEFMKWAECNYFLSQYVWTNREDGIQYTTPQLFSIYKAWEREDNLLKRQTTKP